MNFESRNPNFEERVKEKFKVNHLSHHLGIELTEISSGEIHAEVPLRAELKQQDSIAHGGLTLTLSDVVAGFAAYSLLPEDKRAVTAEIKTSFLRPGKADKLVGIGKVIKPGKHMLFCESEIFAIYEGKSTLIAKATSIMAVI